MRRSEIVAAVQKLTTALEKTQIRACLLNLIKRAEAQGSPPGMSLLLEALHRYSNYARAFGPAEREIATILGLDKLERPDFWSTLFGFGKEPRDPREVAHYLSRELSFAEEQLPKIVRLIAQDSDQATSRSEMESRELEPKVSLLTVILIESQPASSRPARLIHALESINLLYEACAIIEGMTTESLTVAACDSGSDKSFDFLGVDKLMQGVKDIIISVWDRIVFHREKKFAARLELVVGSLPVLERITALEVEGQIAPEQAEILRRKIVDGVGKFIAAGGIIPEIEARAVYQPRELMAPEPKFLTGSVAGEKSQNSGGQRKARTRKREPRPGSGA